MQENSKYYPITHLGLYEFYLDTIDINNLIDICYKTKSKIPSTILSNVNGYQSPCVLKNKNLFSLVEVLNKTCQNTHNNPNFHINKLWINISPPSAHNQIHNHGKLNEVSGVLYLQCPPNSGNFIMYNNIDFNTRYNFTPSPKTLFLFSSISYHLVEPNLSQEDRISIAFNYG
tara:strand:- start:64 stop:582 length:519 start_codon:yes stop_codon:yes gene_type:complete